MNPAYTAAVDADAAWMRAISAAFPTKRAGNVRYTEEGRGAPGTALREAYDAYVAATRAAGFRA